MSSSRTSLFTCAIIALFFASSVVAPVTVQYPTIDGIESANLQSTQTAEAQTIPDNLVDECNLNAFLSINAGCEAGYNGEISNNLDQLQAYQEGLSHMAAADTFNSVFQNYAKDTEDIAWLIAEREIYDALNNGLTQTQAQSKAQIAVQKYYEKKRYNYLDFYNGYLTALDNLKNQSNSPVYSSVAYSTSCDSCYSESSSMSTTSTFTKTFDNINKSIEVRRVEGGFSFWGGTITEDTVSGDYTWDVLNGVNLKGGTTPPDFDHTSYLSEGDTFQASIQPPDPEDGPDKVYFWSPDWTGTLDDLKQTENEVINQMNEYVSNTYQQFKSGNLDNEEALSQVNMLNNLLADVNTSTGSFNEVTSFLAATGMTTPDLDNTSYMEIEYQRYNDTKSTTLGVNTTLEGLLASTTEPPNGSWEIGTRYDTDNLDGSQTVALVEGGMQTLDGEFEIKKVYNEQGESVNASITTKTRDYSVSNTSELQNRTQYLQEEINRLIELREQSNSGGGALLGGGNLFGGGALFGGGKLFGGGGLPTLPGLGVIESAVVAIIAITGLNALSS